MWSARGGPRSWCTTRRPGLLRTVAARGFSHGGMLPVPVDDRASVAARVFRERRIIVNDPADRLAQNPGTTTERGYRGQAFLSIPIQYAAPGRRVPLRRRHQPHRPPGGRQLHPLAGQAGHRRGQPDRRRHRERPAGRARCAPQRLQRELELAHDLQLNLLPSPVVLQGDADVARDLPTGGQRRRRLLHLHSARDGRVGVMLGDVSSHGFSAALVMALVMSAGGIHAGSSNTPDETLVVAARQPRRRTGLHRDVPVACSTASWIPATSG